MFENIFDPSILSPRIKKIFYEIYPDFDIIPDNMKPNKNEIKLIINTIDLKTYDRQEVMKVAQTMLNDDPVTINITSMKIIKSSIENEFSKFNKFKQAVENIVTNDYDLIKQKNNIVDIIVDNEILLNDIDKNNCVGKFISYNDLDSIYSNSNNDDINLIFIRLLKEMNPKGTNLNNFYTNNSILLNYFNLSNKKLFSILNTKLENSNLIFKGKLYPDVNNYYLFKKLIDNCIENSSPCTLTIFIDKVKIYIKNNDKTSFINHDRLLTYIYELLAIELKHEPCKMIFYDEYIYKIVNKAYDNIIIADNLLYNCSNAILPKTYLERSIKELDDRLELINIIDENEFVCLTLKQFVNMDYTLVLSVFDYPHIKNKEIMLPALNLIIFPKNTWLKRRKLGTMRKLLRDYESQKIYSEMTGISIHEINKQLLLLDNDYVTKNYYEHCKIIEVHKKSLRNYIIQEWKYNRFPLIIALASVIFSAMSVVQVIQTATGE